MLLNLLSLVVDELDYQEQKWGKIEERFVSLTKWVGILTEEVGEVSKAVLDYIYSGRNKNAILEEIVDVIAVAMLFAVNRFSTVLMPELDADDLQQE